MMNKKSGFTLMEMSVVIIIIGLVSVAFTQIYALRIKQERADKTIISLSNVESAIANFRGMYGRYPCPASLSVTPGDAALGNTYGRESDCANEAAIALGSCVNGVCVQESVRSDITFTSGGATVGPDNVRIRVGAVPFRQLNLEERDSFDGYGNRILYAVTERLAVSDRFDARNGGIEIVNQEDVSAIVPPSTAHFFIMSAGEDGEGAFSREGVMQPCDTTTSQAENCHITSATIPGPPPVTSLMIDPVAQYRMAERNDSQTVNKFDDMVGYFLQSELPLWQVSETNPGAIHQKPSGNVGFFITPAFTMVDRGEIDGNVRSFNDGLTPLNPGGSVMLNEVCSQDGTDCFPLTKITGDPADADPVRQSLHCGPGEYMVEISVGTQVCASNVRIGCTGGGSYMTGINAAGLPICTTPPPPGCATQEVGICGTTRWLAPTAHGANNFVTAGASRRENYQCASGTWNYLNATGSCTCTPGVTSVTGGIGCGTGYTGTYTNTVTRVCPAGTTTTTHTRATTCNCTTRAPQIAYDDCPAGQTGQITRQRNWVCSTPHSGAWSSWAVVANTCMCDPSAVQTQTLSCSPGWSGSIQQQRTRECPSNEWGAWTTISNTCDCTPVTDTRNVACPPGEIGDVTQQRSFECPSATWTPWTPVSSTCVPTPPMICNWTTGGSAQPNRPAPGGSVNMTTPCDCGDTGACHQRITSSNYTVYSSCVCD